MQVRDPVCGMRFEAAQAQARTVLDGQEYFFCSVGCKAAFDREPHRYRETHHEGGEGGGGHEGHH